MRGLTTAILVEQKYSFHHCLTDHCFLLAMPLCRLYSEKLGGCPRNVADVFIRNVSRSRKWSKPNNVACIRMFSLSLFVFHLIAKDRLLKFYIRQLNLWAVHLKLITIVNLVLLFFNEVIAKRGNKWRD